jgi:hypothetical protein
LGDRTAVRGQIKLREPKLLDWGRMMIIHSKKLIFVHIQRTGGNSVSSAFGENPNTAEKHFLARDLRERYGADVWDSYFKFSFVRNPWDRLVSWWTLINRKREAYYKDDELTNFQRFIFSRASTFDEFVYNCDHEIIDYDGRKWIYRNQIDYLSDDQGRLIVDYVGRFERLESDFILATQRAIGHAIPLPHLNGFFHRHYSEYYSSATAEYVGTRFRRDIEAFGYAFGQ